MRQVPVIEFEKRVFAFVVEVIIHARVEKLSRLLRIPFAQVGLGEIEPAAGIVPLGVVEQPATLARHLQQSSVAEARLSDAAEFDVEILVVMCQLALVVGGMSGEEFAVPVKVTKVWFAGRWEALPAPGEEDDLATPKAPDERRMPPLDYVTDDD